jgi:3-hydroxyacyl-[acyl-carrier-protein] dehydratase
MADADETGRGAIGPLDIGRVMAALPHRYPMLLVDRVEDLILDRSITPRSRR